LANVFQKRSKSGKIKEKIVGRKRMLVWKTDNTYPQAGLSTDRQAGKLKTDPISDF
jgi:hypothetical protein